MSAAGEGTATRIAVLVIGHANPGVFGRLAAALDHPRIRLFVHIDARTDIAPFRAVAGPEVRFLADRIANVWGAWTQVEVLLRLLRAARAEARFASHVVISADSLPLVDNEALLHALTTTPTALHFVRPEPGSVWHRRVTGIFMPHASFGRMRETGFWMDKLRLDPAEFDDILAAMRTAPAKAAIDFTICKGVQWLALSDAELDTLLDVTARDTGFVDIFRYSLIPDETFVHTALLRADPRLRSIPGVMGYHWPGGPSPRTLATAADRALMGPPRTLFFRKFSDEGLALADAVLAERRDWDSACAEGWLPLAPRGAPLHGRR